MSAMAALELTHDPRGTHLSVRAQPNARRAGILGEHGGALALACRASEVVLVSGPSNRSKRFLIVGLDPATIRGRLDRAALRSG